MRLGQKDFELIPGARSTVRKGDTVGNDLAGPCLFPLAGIPIPEMADAEPKSQRECGRKCPDG